eukprot:gb/GFBE01049174.1/.p1 GENE.gb/GFBE01049174.1/~~gb/GFBE01049174.1/.p1  ORF type:complete len:476 (+),score=126.39 gb/GFBE01049174.1/:1-1428(+)
MKFTSGAVASVVLGFSGCAVSKKIAPLNEEQFSLAREQRTKVATMQAQDDDGDQYEITDSTSCSPGLSLLDDFAECRHAADGLDLPFMAYEKTHSDTPGCSYKRAGSMSYVMFNQRPDDADDSDLVLVSMNASSASDESSEYTSRPICANRKFVTSLLAEPPSTEQEAKSLKIFCFAWTTFREGDVKLMPEARKAMQKCNDHRFFSHTNPDGHKESDVTVVQLPGQPVKPDDSQYLWHRNMVGLMPVWDYLIKSGEAKNYDWVINLELDHLFIPDLARLQITQYMNRLRAGKKEWQEAATQSLMFMFGNTFLFNKKMVQQMSDQWSMLGKVAPQGHPAVGCPMFYEGRPEWPLHCSQDMIYPNMLVHMEPKVLGFGNSGCGQPNKDFPMSCFEMSHISMKGLFNQTEIQSQFVRAVKMMDKMSTVDELKHYLEKNAPRLAANGNPEKIWTAKGVSFFHHLGDFEARKLANQLWGL